MIVLDLSLLFNDVPVLVCLPFCWCPCVAINVSVQYDGGFLPDIILVQMTLSRVIDKMVVDEGRALQPCRYRLFTHMYCIILYPYST